MLLLLLKQPHWALGAGTVLLRTEDCRAGYTRAMMVVITDEGWAGIGAVISDDR
jgi:hypothetical protein